MAIWSKSVADAKNGTFIGKLRPSFSSRGRLDWWIIDLATLVKRIAARATPRTEATLQADIRQLLLIAPLGLENDDLRDIVLESQVGDRRRIDVEVGSCVIEVKKDLRRGSVAPEAIEQLSGYVSTREDATGCRYTGILTDGAEWRCLQVVGGIPEVVSTHLVSSTC